ncbi:MAG TPA: flagellar basal body-associated FliL family protein [Bacillota bacterium]|nr:flagellar basal body-associated FliL family protein [Bacillota bacterium]
MAEKKQNNQEGQAEPAANGNSGLIKIIAIVGVVVILVCAGIAYGVSRLVISATGQQVVNKGGEGSTTSASLGTSYDVGTFTTNIAGQDGSPTHIVKVKVVLFLNDAKLSEEMDNKKPMVEDFIIKMLRGKTYEELNKPDSTDKLRKEIREKVNTFLATGRVENVFITDFITQ